MNLDDKRIAIIGLGYVGLPLAVAFAEKYPVVGFDINQNRVNELLEGLDNTLEIEGKQLQLVLSNTLTSSNGFFPTTNSADLANCNIYIVTVPTTTDKHNRPILTPMIKASEMIAKVMKRGMSSFTNQRYIRVSPKMKWCQSLKPAV